ncbi:ABC transporter permease [Algoriphagus sediminis]|uniref:ABC transporter permease n=1 Tax=Algoriphagus sediminis TaxID=3057113 RepID=A0ABT7YHD4_9BACT|nr:ABC transporter permease [Algoriphagus sediminis]MDN3205589.1 ABC transporter permease [Algoriphagus sediminis]
MFFHYLKTTLRGIKFHPFYSIVSILGLSIGLASCLLIFSYWSYERSYDTFYSDADRIYRVYQEVELPNGEISTSASTFSRVGQSLSSEFSGAESVLRMHLNGQNTSLQYGETILSQDGMMGVENNFFEFFDFKFLSGSKQNWLRTPQAVILTEEVATKLFGDEDPFGKAIIINGVYGSYGQNGYEEFKNYTVAGVIENVPGNTHLDFSLLISLGVFANPEREFPNWGESFYTYVKLTDPSQATALEETLTNLGETTFADSGYKHYSMPLTDIHLKSDFLNEFKANGSEQLLILLAALAALVLIVAGCNYINFATARLLQRDKEVNLRKIFWAGKTQLFAQLFFEAIFINLIALGLALILIILINPTLTNLTSIDLLGEMIGGLNLSIILAIVAGAILISGFYPAWYVSRSSKKSLSAKAQGQLKIQRPIVIFQFAISVFVIGFTLLISSQLRFMQKSDPGLNLEKTLVLSGPSVENEDFQLQERLISFKNELSQSSQVNGVSSANFIPGQTIRGEAEGYVRRISDPEESSFNYSFTQLDGNFIDEFGIEILAGRGFSPESEDSDAVIINQEAAKFLGFESPEDAIGERIFYRRQTQPEIVGVISNFHQFSLQEAYKPIIFEKGKQADGFIYIKYNAENEAELLSQIQASWMASFPGNPFDFFYLDEFYNRQYQQDQNFYSVFQIFSALGILVAALGFFGLIYFLAASKVKEIGIRKTLGAEFSDVVKILSNGTLSSLLIAGVFSLPAIYFLGQIWLENYAFRISIGWWILAIPLLAFGLLAFSLILIQAIRSYRANPVLALKEASNGTLER